MSQLRQAGASEATWQPLRLARGLRGLQSPLGIAFAHRRLMSKRAALTPWFWLSGGILAGTALVRWQLGRLFNENPAYELERQIGPLEIRRYAPHCVAETRVSARSWDVALNEGFHRLAGYIFGANRPASVPPLSRSM